MVKSAKTSRYILPTLGLSSIQGIVWHTWGWNPINNSLSSQDYASCFQGTGFKYYNQYLLAMENATSLSLACTHTFLPHIWTWMFFPPQEWMNTWMTPLINSKESLIDGWQYFCHKESKTSTFPTRLYLNPCFHNSMKRLLHPTYYNHPQVSQIIY